MPTLRELPRGNGRSQETKLSNVDANCRCIQLGVCFYLCAASLQQLNAAIFKEHSLMSHSIHLPFKGLGLFLALRILTYFSVKKIVFP